MNVELKTAIVNAYARAVKFGYKIQKEHGLAFNKEERKYLFPTAKKELSLLESVLLTPPSGVEMTGDKELDITRCLSVLGDRHYSIQYVIGLSDGLSFAITPYDLPE